MGKTTAEMKTIALYSGTTPAWDIVTDPSLTNVYPQLRWATNGLASGESIWVIGTVSDGGGSSNNEQTVKDITTTIVNSTAVTPQLPTFTEPKQESTNGFANRVESSLVKTQDVGNDKSLGRVGGGLDPLIRSVNDDARTVPANNRLTLVSDTGGEQKISSVDMQTLMTKSGGGELRVALSPDSFVELVNGGVTLPKGVSQEFYVVEDQK